MGSEFETFSQQHFSVFPVMAVIAFFIIRRGRQLEEPARSDIGIYLAGLTCATVVLDTVAKLMLGTYDYLVDLPFFLCDLVAILLPFIVVFKNRKWIGILYFWALAGTFQAILTPDLNDGFPSFHYFRYFIGHAGIILTIVYVVVVVKIRITWQDFANAIVYAQVYLIAVHMINHILQSNYSYTMQKPPGATVLDLLGPWPWYILFGELLMLLLFLFLMIPFIGKHKVGSPELLENEQVK